MRGVSRAERHLGDLFGVMCLGPDLKSFLGGAGDTKTNWNLSLAREIVPDDALDSAAILADMSPRMEATVRAVTSHMEELRCDELVDRDPLPLWGEGVVTVLADAGASASSRPRHSSRTSTLSRCSGRREQASDPP